MKVIVTEITEHKRSFSRKTRCKNCGGKNYDIVAEYIDSNCPLWFIACPVCQYATREFYTREAALLQWKNKKGE